MPLKIELKPGERVILGACMITNGDRRTGLTIEHVVLILLDKHIITAQLTSGPAKRIYLAIQRTGRRSRDDFATYLRLSRDILSAMPGVQPFIDALNKRILTGDLYKTLKEASKLVAYEEDRQ